MAGSIHIRELRNIEHLDFDIPDPGVWLLTGINGSGKTSLLACLRRIGQPQAFPTHFPSSQRSSALDDFSSASISYVINGREVQYVYGGTRWVPRPRSNSGLMSQFGYPSVVYLGANADRVTPRPEDFNPNRVKNASAAIIKGANEIFETHKFSDLKTISLSKGAANEAFVLQIRTLPSRRFLSEKHFSLGELCILKLLKATAACPNNSLVLVDELEMALHPRAQVKLYEYLAEISRTKNITVTFSTHSATLLKVVPHKNVLFLQRESTNHIEIIRGCFPSFALGRIAFDDERAPDRIIYVQDYMMQYIADALVRHVLQSKFNEANDLFPSVRIIPIGGYDAVVRFLKQSDSIFPAGTKSSALLDGDVKNETIVKWTTKNNVKKLSEFEPFKKRISFFDWTPEVGICDFIRKSVPSAEKALRKKFNDQRITINNTALLQLPAGVDKAARDACKVFIHDLYASIASLIAIDEVSARSGVCFVFAEHLFATDKAKVLTTIAPLVS